MTPLQSDEALRPCKWCRCSLAEHNHHNKFRCPAGFTGDKQNYSNKYSYAPERDYTRTPEQKGGV